MSQSSRLLYKRAVAIRNFLRIERRGDKLSMKRGRRRQYWLHRVAHWQRKAEKAQ